MSEYNYEITDGGLDTLKYRNSIEGSECDNTEEIDSTLFSKLGSCCFPENSGCIENIDKNRCENFGGIFYVGKKCSDPEVVCVTPTPTVLAFYYP